MKKTRGTCVICGYRFRLRLDRTLTKHSLYAGKDKLPPCVGGGMLSKEAKLP